MTAFVKLDKVPIGGYAPHLYNNTIMAENYFIAKVYRQHNSLVITVPVSVTTALGIKRGSHVVFAWNQANGEFKFSKFKLEGVQDDSTKQRK